MLLQRLAAAAVFAVAVFAAVAAGSGRARAHSYGAPSSVFRERRPPSCNGCHRGGVAPIVTLTADAARIAPAAPVLLTLTVTTPNGQPGAAGFDLRANRPGEFSLGGPASAETKVVRLRDGSSEATHRAAKEGEPAVFTVLWASARDVTGPVTFTAWGNAVDEDLGNDGPLGDCASRATVTVTVAPAGWRTGAP